MFHSIKRATVGLAAGKHEPKNAEFENMRNKMENVNKALASALNDIEGAQKTWHAVVDSSDRFAASLHTLYPNEDQVRALFKSALDEVRGPIAEDMHAIVNPSSQVRSIERNVRAYLTEIKTLTAEYNKVENARKDYAMYQAKTEKLDKSSNGTDKQSRNLDKLESSRATYHSILDGTLHRMKTTYDKAPVMFRATHVAFWLYQSRMNDLLSKHFSNSFDYAAQNCDSLFSAPASTSAELPAPSSQS